MISAEVVEMVRTRLCNQNVHEMALALLADSDVRVARQQVAGPVPVRGPPETAFALWRQRRFRPY